MITNHTIYVRRETTSTVYVSQEETKLNEHQDTLEPEGD